MALIEQLTHEVCVDGAGADLDALESQLADLLGKAIDEGQVKLDRKTESQIRSKQSAQARPNRELKPNAMANAGTPSELNAAIAMAT